MKKHLKMNHYFMALYFHKIVNVRCTPSTVKVVALFESPMLLKQFFSIMYTYPDAFLYVLANL